MNTHDFHAMRGQSRAERVEAPRGRKEGKVSKQVDGIDSSCRRLGGFRSPAGLATLALITLATLVVLARGQGSAQGSADGGDNSGAVPALERRVAALEKALAEERKGRLAA